MIITEKDHLDRIIFKIVIKNSGANFGKSGVANFLVNMLNNRGTLKNPNTKFLEKLDNNGITLFVSTSRENSIITTIFLKEKQKIALKLLKELISYPNFTEEAFEKTKLEIQAKMKQKESNFDYIASVNLNKITFPNTPLATPIIGEKIDFNLNDVIQHYKKFFIQENLTFVVGGNFNKIDFEEFKTLFPNGTPQKIEFFKPIQANSEIIKPTEQAYIYFNAPFNISKEERFKAKVSTFILGSGGFGSRILEEIRVKNGFAYSATIHNHFHYYQSIVKGHMQTKLENQEKAISTLKKTITQFVEDGVTEEELRKAKKFLIGSEPLRNELLFQRLTLKFLAYYYGFEKDYWEKELKKIENLTLDELNRFIKEHTELLKLSFSIVKK